VAYLKALLLIRTVRSEVLTALNIEIMASWDVTPCSFVGTVCTESSEVSVSQPTQRHISEAQSIHIYIYICIIFFLLARQPPVGPVLPIHEVFSRSRTTHHSRKDSSGRVTTHNTYNRRTSMPPVGFEPTISADERPQTYAYLHIYIYIYIAVRLYQYDYR
jgi:hypothetical protein